MAKGNNQKLKIVYLMKILLEQTDEEHSITMPELLTELEKYGIKAERKSIYSDIENLRLFGLDVIGEQKERGFHYYIGSRQFELAELKLLVDSIQAAKFITAKKSNELIKKIEQLASRQQATQLQRQVFVAERAKTINEKIYYNVDTIHTAISQGYRITFQYFQWNVKKEMILRKGGALYEVSPWALSWDDENYYLIAYDSQEDTIKHFRVDKMMSIAILSKRREGKEKFQKFDIAVYAKKTFGMFGGEEQKVKMLCRNDFAGVIIDRFGKEVMMLPVDDKHFVVYVNVAVSRQFLAWVFALGEGITVVEPPIVVEKMRQELKRMIQQYSIKGTDFDC